MRLALYGYLAALSHLGAAELPERVDNSRSPAFPPIVRQTHESCAQEVGLSTMMTYAWNRHHGSNAADPNNQFAGRFVWNFLNRGENRGAELTEGWHLARVIGVPKVTEYNTPRSLGEWPSDYSLYYGAMKHRIRTYRSLPLSNEAQLSAIKEHLRQGEIFGIEGRLHGFKQVTIPKGQHEAGKQLVLNWGRKGKGHVMTYVGYDDRVSHDINGDGRLTNDRDLDEDGEITLADWERGAFIAVNSYGVDWGNAGRTYVLYRESAVTPFQRGHWASMMEILPNHQPLLTLRLKLLTTCLSAVRLRIEIDQKKAYTPILFDLAPANNAPTLPNDPDQYNRFLTGKHRLSAGPASQDERGHVLPVELGLDLTGQLPLHAASYRLVFHLDQATHPNAAGTILEASLLRYGSNGTLLSETAFADLPRAMRLTEHKCLLQR